jgi:hypothetical protein
VRFTAGQATGFGFARGLSRSPTQLSILIRDTVGRLEEGVGPTTFSGGGCMTNPQKIRLLFGPYRPPPLKRGDRTYCLYRDCAVVIRALSDGPIPWPRCYYAEGRGRGHGLVVDEELARAIRHESAAAVGHWWRVGRATVQRWRTALGVGRKDNEGTHRLVCGAVQATLDARHQGGRLWAAEEVGLLGAVPDAEAGHRTGRSTNAVSLKRRSLGRPPVRAGRRPSTPGPASGHRPGSASRATLNPTNVQLQSAGSK